MRKQISYETKERIVQLYKMDTLKNLEIAGAYCISMKELFAILEEMKVERKKTENDENIEDAAQKLYVEHVAVDSICQRIGISRTTLYKVVNNANLPKRNAIGSSDNATQIIKLYQNQKTRAEIARTLDLDLGEVADVINTAIESSQIQKTEIDDSDKDDYVKAELMAEFIVENDDEEIVIEEVASAFHLISDYLLFYVEKMKKSRGEENYV